jgi:hypothetical protein
MCVCVCVCVCVCLCMYACHDVIRICHSCFFFFPTMFPLHMFLSFTHMSGTKRMHPRPSWDILRSLMKPYLQKIIWNTHINIGQEKYLLLFSWIFLEIWLHQRSQRPCTGSQLPPWGLHELSIAHDGRAAPHQKTQNPVIFFGFRTRRK